MAKKARKRTLRLVLGDQLNEKHSWFKNRDANVVYVLMEVMQEADYVKEHYKEAFTFEGVGFHASTQGAAGLTEVYRFFNVETGTHFYTPSILEKNMIEATWPSYRFESVGFWVPDSAQYLLA